MLSAAPVLFEYDQGGCQITCLVTGEQWKQNAYLVTHTETSHTMVIDPGDHADFIIRRLAAQGARVVEILLTHPHHDHVGAVAQLSEQYGLDCKLHKLDLRLLMQAPMYALSFAKKRIAPVTRFQTFEELQPNAAQPPVRSIHTPGHTKGSTCFLFDGFVFTGDTLLYRYIGRTDLPGGSLPALNASLDALLAELPDDTVIFPGHGRPWSVRKAKLWWHASPDSPPQHDQFVHS
jgi:glyoxylase-like metal-dependent hydrolase (beta-lactamase superfamily II)